MRLLVGFVAEVLQLDIELIRIEKVAEAEQRGAGVLIAPGVD